MESFQQKTLHEKLVPTETLHVPHNVNSAREKLYIMVADRLHCQLDLIWNHLVDTVLGVSVSKCSIKSPLGAPILSLRRQLPSRNHSGHTHIWTWL